MAISSATDPSATPTAELPPDLPPQPIQTAPVLTNNEPKHEKLLGREFWESIGSPTTIVAPMVEQSELAWRLLSRQHSPPSTLCYTPMFHSRLFATTPVYRNQSFNTSLDGHTSTGDRPLFLQFCSNDPNDLLSAAQHIETNVDAVDLNLGCPQGIAKKGHYGSFLQEDWPLITSLISTLHQNLRIPVTAKIRILETKERSLEYAKMVVAAGATVVTVHGRQRHQKGHNTGLADWSVLKYIRDNLPREIVMFANGNILWREDIDRCLVETGVDGVMSAEGNLYNPALFLPVSSSWNARFPRMDHIGREYFDIIRHQILPHTALGELQQQPKHARGRKKLNEVLKDPNLTAIKSHLFKIFHSLLPRFPEIRNLVGRASTRNLDNPLKEYDEAMDLIAAEIEKELERNPETVDKNGEWVGPDTLLAEDEVVDPENAENGFVVVRDGKRYRRRVPWYRCQPYVRPLPEEAYKKGAMTARGQKTTHGGVRKADDEAESGEVVERVVKKVKTGEEVLEEEIKDAGEVMEAEVDEKVKDQLVAG
ncbi:Dus-domain-containing protein [Ascodesmis nigricans]|uniref:tRNA-dihydrouridine(16/17) synthase [NAD(P)(+)] n=1 Tax=Ascodesmis nigricans TaxID=341454 RepID=A0A4S2MTM0_9PEZI|nr:Dus-domain-containing protein [Ascodesmis nigricans]